MLSCNACMRRCLQAIVGDSVQYTPSLSHPLATKSRRQFRRSIASHTESGFESWKALSHQSSRVESGSADGRFDRKPPGREDWLASRGVRPSTKVPIKSPNFDSKFSMEKHLTYLKDPMKLAEFTRNILRKDDFETAEKVVRAASKDFQCTVSWNHLVDWQLSKGRMNAAIKIYNEMKKRAQTPDAHTYTIIFKGCAEHKDSHQAMTKVLAIYHSMLTDKSPISPNVIHMNAVLKMCAKAQNMDAMFGIAGQMPRHGMRAPNSLTFTTIINALRQQVLLDMRSTSLTPIQKRRSAEKAILNARYTWRDIVERWRKGDFWIDEELVCAMGRLLVVGKDHDKDDVLSLVEQAMDIPRQIPRKGSAARELIEPSSQGRIQSDDGLSAASQDPENLQADGDEKDLTAVDQFESIKPPAAPEGGSAYAQPGQNTLSLVMLVLLELRLKGPATRYWNIFTKERGVRPDRENFNAYLRTLRVTRSSTDTVRALIKMPQSQMAVSTFRIAFATCLRDRNNPHAFANSGKILDLMQGALSQPDVKAMGAYLEVAVTSPAYAPKEPSSGYSDQAKYAQGAQINRALERLGPSFLNLRSILSFGPTTMLPEKRTEYVVSALQLTQRMISVYDMLMDKGMVPREQYLSLTKQRSKLAAFVTRHKHKNKFPTSRETSNQNYKMPVRFLSQLDDPEIQHRMEEAKQSPETWNDFLDDMQASVPRQDDKIDRDAWEMHANTERSAATEALAEEERRAAQAASRVVFAVEGQSENFTKSNVRVRYQ